MTPRIVFFILFSLLNFVGNLTYAQFLSFPLERNGLKVFPQRFEYQLINKDLISIGDILIDASKLDFQFIPVDLKQSKFKLKFRWSAGLLTDGELVIKDNAGKAIWTQKMNSTLIQLTEDPKAADLPYRTQLATIETPTLEKELFNRLRYTAFFKLCIVKTDEDTKIYMCSKDLFLRKTGALIAIETRDSFRKESYVEINGRHVDPQGAIFLNERTDTISMRALLMSGASLEVATRRKEVFFKDVYLSESGEKLIVRAVGSEPIKKDEVKHLGDQDWQVELDSDRPVLYLTGEGGIPLRQEFLVQGNMRKEALQVKVTQGWEDVTYHPEVKLELEKISPDLKFSVNQKGSTLEGETTWVLKDLDTSAPNRRFLNVATPEGKFIAVFDVVRGRPFEVTSRLMYPFFSATEGQWWLSKFHWGLGAKYDKLLLKKSGEADFTDMGFWAHYRFKPGLHMKDPTYGLGATYDILNLGSSVNSMGLDFFAEQKCEGKLQTYCDWWLSRVRLPLAASGSDVSLKTSFDVEATLRKYTQGAFFYEAGVRLISYKFSLGGVETGFSRTMLLFGIGGQF